LEEIVSRSVYPFNEVDEKVLFWLCHFHFLSGESAKLNDLFELCINPKYDSHDFPIALEYFRVINYAYVRDHGGLQQIVDSILMRQIDDNVLKISKFLCDSHYYQLGIQLVQYVLQDPQVSFLISASIKLLVDEGRNLLIVFAAYRGIDRLF
jgi:hypothetical protein